MAHPQKRQSDSLTLFSLVFGLSFVGVSAACLVSKDVDMFEKLQSRRSLASENLVPGSLTGRNAIDGQDWPPTLAGGAQQQFANIVLFQLHAVKGSGDLGFWREVSARVLTVNPEVKFVGLCSPIEDCELGSDQSFRLITLLSAMDPLQMRALAVAKSRKLALIYRGDKFWKHVPTSGTARSLADEILNAFRIEPKAVSR